ncbi:MAG: ABC transporter permease [Candidatus Omnitrophica bacterium]|nr:ABC transporter permease [Candidatus Omnitrophota bacterium]
MINAPPALTPRQRAWRRFKRNRAAVISGLFLALVVLVVLVGPAICPYSPNALSEAQFQPPNLRHWFGTDVHGRDLLVRVLMGARLSLLVGATGAGVSLVIGVIWGAVAGYLGGRWDSAMMRAVDVLYSLPSVVFVIVLITTLEQLFKNWLSRLVSIESDSTVRLLFLFVGLGAVSWLTMARIVRGQVLSLRTRGFVEASRALGANEVRILWRHILPNMYGIIIVYLVLTVPAVILSESFLSYLGLGIQPPQASLGSLIADGAGQINPIRIYWWLIVMPGGILVAMLLALNFLGDGLRDALDPLAES